VIKQWSPSTADSMVDGANNVAELGRHDIADPGPKQRLHWYSVGRGRITLGPW